jgi:hypothetical protein
MKESEIVFLMTVGDDMQAEIIEEALNKVGIPLLKKHREGGAYLSIYMGKSMYGIDLYVSEESYDIARGILTDLGITDIEGKSVSQVTQRKGVKANQHNRVQTRIFKVGIALIFLLWLLLWWRSS